MENISTPPVDNTTTAMAIEMKNVSKSYDNKQVLRDINMAIYPGEIVGYIGPNGAGKSTTVKILIGFLQDYDGEVSVAGYDVMKDTLAVKGSIGYVPEIAELYDLLTPQEYLQFVGKLYGMNDSDIKAGISHYLQFFGLEENEHQRMDTFSKGMRQKILLSAGLLHNPSIIILDEPLSGLDANAVIKVKELLQQLKRNGKTIFYCSHMMDVVEKVCDRIMLIHNGSIIANDTVNALKLHPQESLEQIFSRLTGPSMLSSNSEAATENLIGE